MIFIKKNIHAKKRSLILAAVLCSWFWGTAVLAQISLNEEEGGPEMVADTTIAIPEEFDSTLDYLLHSWIIQRSEDPDCRPDSISLAVSDSVYKVRLTRMPCVMEMPFNNSVRSFIELYTVR